MFLNQNSVRTGPVRHNCQTFRPPPPHSTRFYHPVRSKPEVFGETTVTMSIYLPQIPHRSPSHWGFLGVTHSRIEPNLLLFCKGRASKSLDWSSVTKACTNSTQNQRVRMNSRAKFQLLQSIKYTNKCTYLCAFVSIFDQFNLAALGSKRR
jgi:hypothetical protein